MHCHPFTKNCGEQDAILLLKTKLKTLIISVTGLLHFYMPKGHTVVVGGYKLGVQNDYINVKVLKSEYVE